MELLSFIVYLFIVVFYNLYVGLSIKMLKTLAVIAYYSGFWLKLFFEHLSHC